ncbi:transcriptional regulator, HxlR family [Aliiroseovarius sediminilitoris]|uniref:Transcriptional regulator, HxlR family n=1 Tax=Aliiroseovarius sediminilitoris TaxID=1173584 RepID=A0A1I0NTD5_9RHOB|nr:helix-turn-helix domain-containing protein [Aliiroseovarius sediminilitoris]SEW04963.1 transcriptional regulator, HxlR family [Aliiroseovarius sediminilitoris]
MNTRKNMLFCPVTMACEVLQPRWTIQILAEMWWGSTRFNEIRRGIPGISPTLLTKRLKELQAHGLIERVENSATGMIEYLRTAAAVELEPVIQALGNWAYRNTNTMNGICDADAKGFVWNLRRSIDVSELPARRVAIQISFPEQETGEKNFWIVCKPGAPVDICYLDPGHNVDLFITAELAAMISVYFGHTSLSTEIDGGRIILLGQASLARSIDRWLIVSSYGEGILAEMHSSGV